MVFNKTFNELYVNELHSILMLRSEVFVVEQNCVYQDIDELDLISSHIFLKENNKVIAYLRVIPLEHHSSIGRVVVSHNHRRKSYGKLLMNEAINYIHTSDLNSNIIISAQRYLISFYESFGFETDGEGYLEDGIPHIKMRLNLKSKSK